MSDRARPWRRRLALASLAAIVVGIFAVGFGDCYIGHRADGLVFTAATDVPRHAYAIVPGAMVRRGGVPSEALVDRLEAARALYATGRVDAIFVSGDARDHDEDGVMNRWLVEHGVPAGKIIRDGFGYRTRTTMEDAQRIGITDAVICTQEFHLPRSIAWARHLGITAVGLRADLLWTDRQQKSRIREVFARTVAMFEIWLD